MPTSEGTLDRKYRQDYCVYLRCKNKNKGRRAICLVCKGRDSGKGTQGGTGLMRILGMEDGESKVSDLLEHEPAQVSNGKKLQVLFPSMNRLHHQRGFDRVLEELARPLG